MIILSANKLTKAYGEEVIFKDVSFSINAGDKVGLIGKNGTGKTTLLNILSGEWDATEGEFFVPQDVKVGYLKQRDNFFKEDTVIEAVDGIYSDLHRIEAEIAKVTEAIDREPTKELIARLDSLNLEYESKGGYTYKSEMAGVLQSMGFPKEEYPKRIQELSGGEKTRLALATLLLEKPGILILDEPTNHLDIDTLKWLEQYLASYRGTMIVVSHDRYFLDRVVDHILEIDNKKLYSYKGNYSQFAEKKKARREAELKAYNIQQKEIRRQEEIIRVMMGHNTEHLVKRAQSREKRLQMIDRLEKPESSGKDMKLTFKQDFKSGSDVLQTEDLGKTLYDREPHRHLFSHLNMDIKRGERVCIVGPNGVGKTTLLRMIMGELKPTEGRIKLGVNVAFGYYDQGQQMLHDDLNVIEELRDSYHLYSDTELRNILGRFLFRGEDVFLKVGSLSGGEKARLTLAKLMMSGANTLILDEPTNHMDIESREVFEEALMDFEGTSVIVSHDRYFLEKIPTRILELTPEGAVEYLGNYDYYLEKKEENEALRNAQNGSKTASEPGDGNRTAQTGSKEERAQKKAQEASERRLRREIEKTEAAITSNEEEMERLRAEMADPAIATDFAKLGKLGTRLEELRVQTDELYELWEKIQQG
ncbi:MAG: ATP-binding cassette domain-containing protein [Firmicutes bacterium]|nr:ATP-binding cassette domain-containing protein [Bacillota bacterium]MBQ1825142.1 ATP-binding cassette domain-containing protein [Bacillota bacterium]